MQSRGTSESSQVHHGAAMHSKVHGAGLLPALLLSCGSGPAVKALDVICWRSLEGRPCISAQDRQLCSSTSVVIIPVATSLRRHKTAAAAAAAATATAAATAAAAAAAPVPGSLAHQANSTPQDDASAVPQHLEVPSSDPVLIACQAAAASLAAHSIAYALDTDPKVTTGAKFHKWEQRGVTLRLEVGPREAASSKACIAVHPHFASIPAVQQAAQQVHQLVSGACGEGRPSDPLVHPGSNGRACKVLVPIPALGEACAMLLQAACLHQKEQQQRSGLQEAGQSATYWDSGGGDEVGCVYQPPCTKLHLFSPLSGGSQPSAYMHQAAGHPHSDPNGPHAASLSRGPSAGEVCSAHLRYLVGAAKACHCGVGHVPLSALKAELTRQYVLSNPGTTHVSWSRRQMDIVQSSDPTAAASSVEGNMVARGPMSRADASALPHEEQEEGLEEDKHGDQECGISLFVSGVPLDTPCSAVRTRLLEMFAPYGAQRVSTSRTRSGCTHGWARVQVPSMTQALAAINALDGKQHLPAHTHPASPSTVTAAEPQQSGAALNKGQRCEAALCLERPSCDVASPPLMVSLPTGRRDTLFPNVPYSQRRQLRVDAVAAYSVTDQSTAERMAGLVATVAAMLWDLPAPAPGVGRRPLPLTVTDGTACCGGNTLALLGMFSSVCAVELDEDRCMDLVHNLQVMGYAPCPALAGARRQQATVQQAEAVLPCAGGHAGATSQPCVVGSHGEVPGKGHGIEAERIDATHGQAPAQRPPQCQVARGDYVGLSGQLKQHVAFLDPPWGGPQYSGDAISDALRLGTKPLIDLCADLLVAAAQGQAAQASTGLKQAPADTASNTCSPQSVGGTQGEGAVRHCGVEVPLSGHMERDGSMRTADGRAQAVTSLVALKLPSKLDCTSFAGAVSRQLQGHVQRWQEQEGLPSSSVLTVAVHAQFGRSSLLLLGVPGRAAGSLHTGGTLFQDAQLRLRAALKQWAGGNPGVPYRVVSC